jgi:galactokinase
MKDLLLKKHFSRFRHEAEITVFAPGRVNFIGEHTDYNGGLVMPLALRMGVYVAASKNNGKTLNINSADFKKYGEFPLESLAPDRNAAWANCPKGIVKMILDKGHKVPGLDLTITGDLPIGAGLSSSAAVEVGVGFAVSELFHLKLDKKELALMSQEAEHAFTGAKCGIMDQMISALGKKDRLMMLSCRDLKIEYAPFSLGSAALLIVNTRVKHNLAESAYNERRRECAGALDLAKKDMAGLASLSDYPLERLVSRKKEFPALLYRRFHHVLTENLRVRGAAKALKKKNLALVGSLMLESHKSLRDDYEVSCPELDWIVEKAMSVSGVYGARMTGGGFGGCAIVLLEKKATPAFRESLKGYLKAFGAEPEVYEALPGDGVRAI